MEIDYSMYQSLAEDISLPYKFVSRESPYIPAFSLNENEKKYLYGIMKTEVQARKLERDTISQASCQLWHLTRKFKITSSKAHKILIRQRNFENLIGEFTSNNKKNHELPKSVRDNFEHGKRYEPIARNLYKNVMDYKLKHKCSVRETGCVVQPNLPWLLASPDGLVVDCEDVGLIEIKCPKTKANHTLEQLLADEKFYVGRLKDGTLYLKKAHSYGYYTQIQMAMGMCGLSFCDFIVYTFKTIIIIRTFFDREYFTNLVSKLNKFYEKYLLKYILENKCF